MVRKCPFLIQTPTSLRTWDERVHDSTESEARFEVAFTVAARFGVVATALQATE